MGWAQAGFAVLCACLVVSAGPVQAQTTEKDVSKRPRAIKRFDRSVKFAIDPNNPIYEVGTHYSYTLTLWTPIDCYEPAVGNPKLFSILYDDEQPANRRFFVTSKKSRPGTTTSVTLTCEGGVRLVIHVKQVKPEDAILSVEFEFDPASIAGVRHAVEQEQRRCAKALTERESSVAASTRKQLERDRLAAMLERFGADDDVESARDDYVVLTAFRQATIGSRGYLLFEIKNRSDDVVTVGDISVTDDGDANMKNIASLLQKPQVRTGETVVGVVAFDRPEDKATFTLRVKQRGGSRVLKVRDVDF